MIYLIQNQMSFNSLQMGLHLIGFVHFSPLFLSQMQSGEPKTHSWRVCLLKIKLIRDESGLHHFVPDEQIKGTTFAFDLFIPLQCLDSLFVSGAK